jgi:hypothetical protein
MTSDDKLDRLLTQHFRNDTHPGDADAGERVLAKLSGPLPPQRRAWRHWPSALLTWDLAPAWPRMAALAGCTVLGFATGVATLSFSERDGWFSPARGEYQLAAALSDPEPMTGVLP